MTWGACTTFRARPFSGPTASRCGRPDGGRPPASDGAKLRIQRLAPAGAVHLQESDAVRDRGGFAFRGASGPDQGEAEGEKSRSDAHETTSISSIDLRNGPPAVRSGGMVRRKANRVNRGLSTGAREILEKFLDLSPAVGVLPGPRASTRGLIRRVARRRGARSDSASWPGPRSSKPRGIEPPGPLDRPSPDGPASDALAWPSAFANDLRSRASSKRAICLRHGSCRIGLARMGLPGRRGRGDGRELRSDRGLAGEGRRCPGRDGDLDRGADRLPPFEGDVQVVVCRSRTRRRSLPTP